MHRPDKKYFIDPMSLQILDDGFLDNGYYWYRVQAIMEDDKTLDLANHLRVYAPHRANTVGIFWDEVPGAVAYKVFRRAEDGKEGSITIDSPAFFHDNGLVQFQ